MPKRAILIQLIIATLFACTTLVADERLPDPPQANENPPQKQYNLSPKETKPMDYAPGQILVKFKDGTDFQTIKNIQAEMHLEILKLVYKPNVYLMKILDNSSVESVIERLQYYKEVIYSEPNYMIKPD